MTQAADSGRAGGAASTENVMGARIGAALIDIAILIVVFFIFGAVFGNSSASSDDGGAGFSVNLTGLPAVLYFVVAFGYYFLLEGARGQTLGKTALKIRVVGDDGSTPTYGSIAIRTILRIVDGLPVFYLLGLIVAAVSQKNQRIGDIAAKTLVVRIAN